MVEKNYVDINNLEFVGIGKLLFDFKTDWNIPQLHFLISKEKDIFQAVNLEMQLFTSGENEAEAIASLITITKLHIDYVMKEVGFSQFIDDAKSCTLEKYWSKYRELEFIAASKKQDLSNDIEQRIEHILKQMIVDECKRQDIDIAEIVDMLFTQPRIMYKKAA